MRGAIKAFRLKLPCCLLEIAIRPSGRPLKRRQHLKAYPSAIRKVDSRRQPHQIVFYDGLNAHGSKDALRMV